MYDKAPAIWPISSNTTWWPEAVPEELIQDTNDEVPKELVQDTNDEVPKELVQDTNDEVPKEIQLKMAFKIFFRLKDKPLYKHF